MKSILIVAVLIIAMILAKIFFFPSKVEKASGPMPAAPGKSMAGGPGGGPGAAPAMRVDILVAQESMSEGEIVATGSMVANESVDLRSEVSGLLTALNIKEGSYVNKGQLIAKIKDSDLRASLKKLEYEAELAQQIEARQKKLLDINAISKEEHDIALNKINTLSADRELLEVSLRQTEVRAPFSGRIGFKNISLGAYITPTTSIATLVQTNPIKMDFTVPEKYSSRIKVGSKVSINLDGSDKPYNATVVALDPTVDQTLRTIKVRTSLPNSGGELLPGMFVRVNVPLGAHKTIKVPTEAIIPFAGGKKVFLVKNGMSVERAITSGTRTDKLLEVTSGIDVGDTIVVSGLMNIKEGQPILAQKTISVE